MSSAPDRSTRGTPDRPTREDRDRSSREAADRSTRDAPDGAERPGLRQRIADGRWPLFALEVLVLAVIFGWLFLTVAATGGNLPW